MASVIQLIETDADARIDGGLVEEAEWHAMYSVGDPTTVCGVQLMGEDGIAPGPERQGRVTCGTCRQIIEQIQAIKDWR